jgi:RNA polymerase sigma factor (sigma-70 family)
MRFAPQNASHGDSSRSFRMTIGFLAHTGSESFFVFHRSPMHGDTASDVGTGESNACSRARRVDDPEQAADLTAHIFTRALAALPRYREDGGSFRSWLFSIAHNTVIDSYRTRYEHVSIEADDLGRTLAHPAHGPEQIALQRDLRDAFRAAMAELTEAQREVVAMRLAGLTGPEIASAAGMSLAAVKSTQFRAYTRLRDLLSHYADTDPGKDTKDA